MDIKHVAIIPDGNRRWAKEKGLPSIEGHRRGSEILLKLINKAKELDIAILTFWAFSTENWSRNKKEVGALMNLFVRGIDTHLKEASKNQIRIIHIGRKDRLSNLLRDKIAKAEEETKKFAKYFFVLGLDYGGRDEMLRAIQQVQSSNLKAQSLNEQGFNQFLDTKDLPYPNPDLIIRTSGEMRTSGFMIWQSAYAEWVFYPKYFPDFTVIDFEKCIADYLNRQRRFGR